MGILLRRRIERRRGRTGGKERGRGKREREREMEEAISKCACIYTHTYTLHQLTSILVLDQEIGNTVTY
jgi:hypothetical protein